MELDAIDMGILRGLRQDARTSFRTLAGQLGTTTPTVSARVKRLESLRIIQGYRVDLDPQALGGSLQVLRLEVRPAGLHRVTEALTEMQGVEEIMAISGGSLLVKVRLRPPVVTFDGLHQSIAGLDDVIRYDAWEVWSVRQRSADIAVTGLELRCHTCHSPIQGEPVRSKIGGEEHLFCCPLCKKQFQERHAAATARTKSEKAARSG
ncbi:MAG: AsnC family transcriptional regulator [Candidatus Thermoplasmatota archaeon]